MHIVLIASVFLLLGHSATAECVLVTSPCDDKWESIVNQTFQYVVMGGTSVQLNSYWGLNYGCTNNALTVGEANCQAPDSMWGYSPADIKNFVAFTNSQTGLCLTNMGSGVVVVQACQGPNFPDAQLWLEPPTTADPYNRIISKVNFAVPTQRWCLTRVNTPPGQNGPCA